MIRRFVARFLLLGTLASIITLGATVAPALAQADFAGCTGLHLHQIGATTIGVTQPAGTQFEGVKTVPLTWHPGAPCTGHGTTNASDGGTNTAWIMLSGGGNIAQIGIGYDPTPAWNCDRGFLYVVSPYENITSYFTSCLADGYVVEMSIEVVTTSCPLYSSCEGLYFDKVRRYTTRDSPRQHWGTMGVSIGAEVNDDWSDMPKYCAVGGGCGTATVPPADAVDFNRLKVQKFDGVFYNGCYGNVNFGMSYDGSAASGTAIWSSRYAANMVPYGCSPVVGTNRFRSWTYA